MMKMMKAAGASASASASAFVQALASTPARVDKPGGGVAGRAPVQVMILAPTGCLGVVGVVGVVLEIVGPSEVPLPTTSIIKHMYSAMEALAVVGRAAEVAAEFGIKSLLLVRVAAGEVGVEVEVVILVVEVEVIKILILVVLIVLVLLIVSP